MLFLFAVILLDPLSSTIDSSSPPISSPTPRDDADSEGFSDSFLPFSIVCTLYIYINDLLLAPLLSPLFSFSASISISSLVFVWRFYSESELSGPG